MNKLRVFESFAGVGSQRMALRNIGCNFEVVGISEVDKNALLAYDAIHENQDEQIEEKTKDEMLKEMRDANIAYNFSTGKDEMPRSEKDIRRLYIAHKRSRNYGDITKINTDTLPDFDFFTYSFPCKNISIAGKQAGLEKDSGTQSSLVWECERIIRAKKPKYLMMENVKNICGKAHMPAFQEWIDLLSDIGYKSYWKVFNGKDYGVPQNRERVIMISILGDEKFCFPHKTPLEHTVKDLLELNVDKKYYIDSNKLIIKKGIMDGLTCAIGASRGRYIDKLDKNKGTKQHLEVNKNEISNSLTTVSTDNLVCLNQVGILDVKGNESNRRVYDSNGLCPTINSMNGGNRQPKMLVDNISVRKLTPIECWRIMGFSDSDYYKAKDIGELANSKLYERAGRGIVVPMLEAIFKELFKEYIS